MFKELKETMLKGLKEGMKIIMLIKGLLHPEDITAIKKNIHLKTAPKCMKQKLTGFIEEQAIQCWYMLETSIRHVQ